MQDPVSSFELSIQGFHVYKPLRRINVHVQIIFHAIVCGIDGDGYITGGVSLYILSESLFQVMRMSCYFPFSFRIL